MVCRLQLTKHDVQNQLQQKLNKSTVKPSSTERQADAEFHGLLPPSPLLAAEVQ